jgi:hypothetical protein
MLLSRDCRGGMQALPCDRASYRGGIGAFGMPGVLGGPPRRCISIMFIFMPFDMIMSPGFWSAAHGPSHWADIVMVLVPAGAPSPCVVTVIV